MTEAIQDLRPERYRADPGFGPDGLFVHGGGNNNWGSPILRELWAVGATGGMAYAEDASAVLVPIPSDDDFYQGNFIALNRYKQRGTTSGAYILHDYSKRELPEFLNIFAAIAALEQWQEGDAALYQAFLSHHKNNPAK